MSQTARQLSQAFQDGRDTPSRVLARSLEALARVPAAFITLLDSAAPEAEAATRRWQRGRPLGPLDGVPVAWKDLIDVAGSVTTGGRQTTGAVAAQDAPIVALARQAGLVGVGKTNLSELAYSGLGLNPHHGTPDNAVRAGHVPGGSSSGAAISVAAGVVPLSVGTDTGGSIRIPAAFNGLAGYRPTIGRYPQAGIQALAPSFDTVGPLAQTVDDLLLFDEVLTGRAAAPSVAPRLAYDHAYLETLPIQPDVWQGFLAAIRRLRAAGMAVKDTPVAAWRGAFELIAEAGWPGAVEAHATHRALLAGPEAAQLDPRVRARLQRAASTDPAVYQRSMARRAELQILDRQAGVLVLTPTVALTAPSFAAVQTDEDFVRLNLDTLRFTMMGSLLDQPGVTLPVGRDRAGLPFGLLVSGPSGMDAAVLAAARELERRLGPD